MDAVLESIQAALTRHTHPDDRLCIALSGGRDSVVLLHALVQLRRAANIRNPLEALHVHHGLSPKADEWAAFCVQLCAKWEVPLQVKRVTVQADGKGLEAAARDARYAAFATCTAPWLLQAHHADDQVETLLLRLSRGTGLRGLAGMPEARAIQGGLTVLRPLLRLPRPDIERHAAEHGLSWIDDESNVDTRLDRNCLRIEVIPRLAERFPAWRGNWGRAAQHAADALSLLDELACMDALDAAQDRNENSIRLERLRSLSSKRLQNVLRWMVTRRGEELPDAARLADVERCLRTCAADSHLGIRFGNSALFHHRGQLFWAPARQMQAPATFSRQVMQHELPQAGSPQCAMKVPELSGTLVLERVLGDGIALRHLQAAPLRLHGAEPGGRLKLSSRQPHRTLKNLWQEAGIPPWERDWLPRLSLGNGLVWVAGLGLDASLQAAQDEAGLKPVWYPEPIACD